MKRNAEGFSPDRRTPIPRVSGEVTRVEGTFVWIRSGKKEPEKVYVDNAKEYAPGDPVAFTMTGAYGIGNRNFVPKGTIEKVVIEALAQTTTREPVGEQEEDEEKKIETEILEDGAEVYREAGERGVEYDPEIDTEVFEPLFVVGVVTQDEEGTYVAIDKNGYDRRVREYVPDSLETPSDMVVNDIVVLRAGRREDDEEDWVLHKKCGQVGDPKAEIEALAFRSGSDPEFSAESDAQVAELRERYTRDRALDQENGRTDDRTFMEREATTFIDNEGRERQGSLVYELNDYRHGENRLDLRDRSDIDIFTIDPKDARDFDDAISYRQVTGPDGKKTYEIGIHIADVAHFARLGSAIEKDARLRQFTRYLKQMTATMLPEFLSNTLCSLEQGKDRLAFSTIFTFNEDGTSAREPWFGKSIIKSKSRLKYDEADVTLHSDRSPRGKKLRNLKRFTDIMRSNRKTRGAIAFDQKAEAKVEYGPDGKALRIYPKEREESSLLIEDLMLAANEAQADYLGNESLILLRAHPRPKIENVLSLGARVIGWDPENPENAEIVEAQEAYDEALALEDEAEQAKAIALLEEGEALGRLINNIRRRENTVGPRYQGDLVGRLRSLLGSAIYTTEREEHISLAVEPYLHATSPIRRYPDLIVQYLLDEKLRRREGVSTVNPMSKAFLQEIADRANVARYQARRAEQDVLELAFLDLVEQEGKGAVFSGRNAVIVDAGRRGVKVAVTLKDGHQHHIEIPWDQFKNVQKNEQGRIVYRLYRNKDGEEKWVDARSVFGASKTKGYSSLTLKVRRINRKNREVLFEIQMNKDRILEKDLAPRHAPKKEAKPIASARRRSGKGKGPGSSGAPRKPRAPRKPSR